MKKIKKPIKSLLTLRHETLHSLQPKDLAIVVGGAERPFRSYGCQL